MRERRRRRATIGDSFSDRSNSLNFLRLLLAASVVIAHAFWLGGFAGFTSGKLSMLTVATVAVYGFFGISGFLIVASASRNSFGRYLWQRFLRIFPAFWMVLLVTALGFGLIAWSRHSSSCSLGCYLTNPHGAIMYVYRNALLRVRQPSIAHTLRGVPLTTDWNGSLWSLYYEFLCYLIVGSLALIGFVRRRICVAIVAAACWIFEAVVCVDPGLNIQFTVYRNSTFLKLITLVPVFLVGSVLWLYKDRLPDSGLLAAICVVAFIVSIFLPLGNGIPNYTITSFDPAAPLLAYPLLWLGVHLPFQRVGSRNDYSYGIYIYAFPVQQLLALYGVNHLGLPVYAFAGLLVTVPFAIASWWVVEKRALRLKRIGLPTRRSATPARVGVAFESIASDLSG